MASTNLTESMWRALAHLATIPAGSVVMTSRELPASSVEALVDRGLASRHYQTKFVTSSSRTFYRITDAGREMLSTLDEAQVSAQVRYIARCGACKCATSTLARNVGRADAEMGALLPLGSTRHYLAIRCRMCGLACKAIRVTGRLNPDHKCDARCTSATGHSCECSCGGKNHGAAHA